MYEQKIEKSREARYQGTYSIPTMRSDVGLVSVNILKSVLSLEFEGDVFFLYVEIRVRIREFYE